MIFSMNGFRRQLSSDVDSLKKIVEEALTGQFYEDEDLVNAMNEVITHSNVVNCVYDIESPEFIDMSDLEIDHIEPKS